MSKKDSKSKKTTPSLPLYIRGWRAVRKNMSQATLAELTHTTAATISRIENCKQNWDQEFLQLASKALDCAPIDLLTRNPADPANFWQIYHELQPKEKAQANRVMMALKASAGE